MLSNPNLVCYACIAKGPTILAEFSSKDKEAGIESLAQECIEKTPPLHSMFSHTVSKRTYTFLIDDPFAYFLIFHEDLEKSESFWFLDRLKCALEDFLLTGLIVGTDNLTPNCLQSHFNPVFSEIMDLDLDLDSELVTTPRKENRNLGLHSNKGKRTVAARAPLLGKQIKGLKKKRRLSGFEAQGGGEAKDGGAGSGNVVENTVDVSDDFRDFPVSMHKSGAAAAALYMGGGDRQKARQSWTKHVWVVLILDLLVIATLFGIWLWVCKGFQCIDG